MSEQPDQPVAPPVKSIAHDAVHDLLHFDRKVFRTVPVLLFKPGVLTNKSLQTDQADYVKPFALFVFLNFIFFLVKSKSIFHYTLEGYSDIFERLIAQKQKALGLTTQLLSERFNTAMHFEEKEYLVVMVPLFALLLQLLFLARRKKFAEHFIFSLHFYSFFILFLILLPVLSLALQWIVQLFVLQADFMHSEMVFGIFLLAGNFIYLRIALNRVYGGNWLLSILKSLLLSAAVILLIVFVYRTLMFFIVMHSISE